MTLFPQEVGPDRALEAVEAWKRQQTEIGSAKIAALAKQEAAQASAIERAQIEQANRDAKNAFWRERGLKTQLKPRETKHGGNIKRGGQMEGVLAQPWKLPTDMPTLTEAKPRT